MKTFVCGGGKIYSIPMSDIEYIGYFYGSNGKEYVKSAYARLTKSRGRAPDFLFNAEYFDFGTRKPATDVVSGGKIHRLTENFGIAFPNNTKAVFSYKNNVGAKDYVGGNPVLIRNGKIETSVGSGTSGSRGRTAIGVGNNNFYVALIPDGSNDVTLQTLRSYMKSAGATDAINLDGGGSTQFYAPNGNYFSTRQVRGFIGIWLKKTPTKTQTSQPVQNIQTQKPAADIRTVKVKTNLRIRKTPSTLGLTVGRLYNGDKVAVLETKGNWCRISKGWVSASYLKK